MKLELLGNETLTLEETDTFTVYELHAGGGIEGFGTLITCCELLEGPVAETINLVCLVRNFSAQAVSVSGINVYLPTESRGVDIRRRRHGTGEQWQVIVSDYSAEVYLDEESTLHANTVYEYQWRPTEATGDEGWSASDLAWLTRTFDRVISTGAPGIVGVETTRFRLVAAEFFGPFVAKEVVAEEVVAQEFAPRLPVQQSFLPWEIVPESGTLVG